MLTLKERVLACNCPAVTLSPEVIGEDEISARSNYFIGSNADKWLHDIANYQRVRLSPVSILVRSGYYGRDRDRI